MDVSVESALIEYAQKKTPKTIALKHIGTGIQIHTY